MAENVPSKWADGLGQVHGQYGTFAKLRTSSPCQVGFEVVLFFFEGDTFWRVREHEANRTPDISATFIDSRKKYCKSNRMFVCPARNKRRVFCLSPIG